ncbi:Uncharacterized low-complexity proteins [Arthrobacter sp. 31Cvi3.1E]|nr:Uncharacterized low-complexity proteins [Arthrobacter sp. 31Cvi3.1E]
MGRGRKKPRRDQRRSSGPAKSRAQTPKKAKSVRDLGGPTPRVDLTSNSAGRLPKVEAPKVQNQMLGVSSAKTNAKTFIASCAAFWGCLGLVTFIPKVPEWYPETFSLPVLLNLFAICLIWYFRKSILRYVGMRMRTAFWVLSLICTITLTANMTTAILRAYPKEVAKQAEVPQQDADLSNRTVSEISYSGKDLSHARFNNSQIHNVSFVDSNLTQSSFAGASIDNVDFTGSNLCGADFRGSDLSRVTTLGRASKLDFFIYDEATKFPDGGKPEYIPGFVKYQHRSILISCQPGITNLVR